jgi:hypothetical protein
MTLSPNESARISMHVSAARAAMALAQRFASKQDEFNANQARLIALRAIQSAREIASGFAPLTRD